MAKLLQPQPVEIPRTFEGSIPEEMELIEVAKILRRDMEILCPTPDHPAYIPSNKPPRQGAKVIYSAKAIYEDPTREPVLIGAKRAEPVTRAYLARFPEEADLVYVTVDSSLLLPMSTIAGLKRPGAEGRVVHARFFPDGSYEFNPALYGEQQTIDQRKAIMEQVIDTVIEIGNQQEFEIARDAVYLRNPKS